MINGHYVGGLINSNQVRKSIILYFPLNWLFLDVDDIGCKQYLMSKK